MLQVVEVISFMFLFRILPRWSMYHGDRVPGFPRHPHRGFETLTILLQGTVDHTDSLGNAGRYGPGDNQWMTAGRGISHSEMFPLVRKSKDNPLQLFQIWLNLPRVKKMADPAFVMHWREQVPVSEVLVEQPLQSTSGGTGVASVGGAESSSASGAARDGGQAARGPTGGAARGLPCRLRAFAGEYDDGRVVFNKRDQRPPPPPRDSWAADVSNCVAVWVVELNFSKTVDGQLAPSAAERRGWNRAEGILLPPVPVLVGVDEIARNGGLTGTGGTSTANTTGTSGTVNTTGTSGTADPTGASGTTQNEKVVHRTLYLCEGGPIELVSANNPAAKRVIDKETNPQVSLESRHGCWLRPGMGCSPDTVCLVLQGAPIGEPVKQHGPFVMSTEEELLQAFRDYQGGQFGGWPWEGDGVVHARGKGRFAFFKGGNEDIPPGVR